MELTETLKIIWHVVLTEIKNMWWFTLLSVLIASLIKTYQLDLKIRMLLQRKIKTGIFFATIAGMISPLCSCGILPIAISLAAAGVPLPPLVSLLFTSPVMGPEAFIITYGGLGFKFAMAKLIFSFLFGILMGFVFLFLQKINYFSDDVVRITPVYDDKGELRSSYEIACENKIKIKTMTVLPRDSKFRFFLDRFIDMGVFIGSLTLLAIVIEGVLYAIVPQNLLKNILSFKGFGALLVTAFFGLIIPLNQIASVPIIKGLMNLGMPLSSGLTLMFSGAVTSVPSAIVLYKIFKTRVLIVFFTMCLVFSVLAGVFFL